MLTGDDMLYIFFQLRNIEHQWVQKSEMLHLELCCFMAQLWHNTQALKLAEFSHRLIPPLNQFNKCRGKVKKRTNKRDMSIYIEN